MIWGKIATLWCYLIGDIGIMNNQYVGRNVVLVDENDNKLGLEDIWVAHKNPGKLHRAISVVLWRKNEDKLEFLLQQRSEKKPLWPLFWSNTVCTHPLDGEGYIDCGIRRLREEMGIEYLGNNLKIVDRLQYQADYNNQLSENELDTIIFGEFVGEVKLNPDEAAESRWTYIDEIRKDIKANPSIYTPWFKILVSKRELISSLEK